MTEASQTSFAIDMPIESHMTSHDGFGSSHERNEGASSLPLYHGTSDLPNIAQVSSPFSTRTSASNKSLPPLDIGRFLVAVSSLLEAAQNRLPGQQLDGLQKVMQDVDHTLEACRETISADEYRKLSQAKTSVLYRLNQIAASALPEDDLEPLQAVNISHIDISKVEDASREAPVDLTNITYNNNNSNNDSNNNNGNSSNRFQELIRVQRDMTTQEILEEQLSTSILTAELADMTELLKDSTLRMRRMVVDQNTKLDDIQQHVVDNADAIADQSKKMKERSQEQKYSLFSTISTYLLMLALFAMTYIVMRIFPKP